jgi:hypothetical protein
MRCLSAQVHNLIRPSDEILRNPKRMQNVKNLRQLLKTCGRRALLLNTALTFTYGT